MSQQLNHSDRVNTSLHRKQSVMGILSFLISLPVGFLYLVTVIFLIAPTVMHHMGFDTTDIGWEFPGSLLIGVFGACLFLLQVFAFGLGFIVLFLKHRIKIFAILGMLFSGFSILLTLLVYLYVYLTI